MSLALSGCNGCTLFGDVRWEVGLWAIPEDVDTLSLTTVDRYEGERTCTIQVEPLETRGDFGPGPDEPEFTLVDCPDASWVYMYIWALHVNNDAPRKFGRAEVSLEYTLLDGTTGGFDPVVVHPDWYPDTLDTGEEGQICSRGATADTQLSALTGNRFSPP